MLYFVPLSDLTFCVKKLSSVADGESGLFYYGCSIMMYCSSIQYYIYFYLISSQYIKRQNTKMTFASYVGYTTVDSDHFY